MTNGILTAEAMPAIVSSLKVTWTLVNKMKSTVSRLTLLKKFTIGWKITFGIWVWKCLPAPKLLCRRFLQRSHRRPRPSRPVFSE